MVSDRAVFRQPAFGDWESVIRRVVEELPKRFVAGDSGKKGTPGT
jgi:hypothetical protein